MARGLLLTMAGIAVAPFVLGCTDRLGLDSFPPVIPVFPIFEGDDQPSVPTPAEQTPLGLDSAVAGNGTVRFEWRAPSTVAPLPDLAVLLSDQFGTPVGASPYAVSAGVVDLVVTGLSNGQLLEATLGLRPAPGDPFAPVGPTLSIRTGAPVYVDVAAAPGGDGNSPTTPSNDLILAVLLTFSGGGGNIWVAGGNYPGTSLPLFGNVDLYGGFPPDFDLGLRSTSTYPTRLQGILDLPVASLLNSNDLSIFDGFQLLGGNLAGIGLEVEDSPFEGRKIEVSNCKRGIKFRRGPFSDSVNMQLVASSSRQNTLQGLSGEGPLKLIVDGCVFSGNGQEGLELAGWLAPAGENLRLTLRDCSFTGNGGEGVDVDMIAPFGAGAVGGHFALNIESCTAQTNALAGFLVDIDYDTATAWSSDIVFHGCYSRGNGGAGIALDLDASSKVLVHRAALAANRSHGLQITSETPSGTVTVSASAIVGNLGYGIQSTLGNFGVLTSQSLLSGNLLGGVRTTVVPASVVSSIAYLQGSPWPVNAARFVALQPDADPAPFLSAPRGFAQVFSQSGSSLTLSQAPTGSMNAIAELSDDGLALDVLSISGATIQVSPAPTNVSAPHPLAFYGPGSRANDDYELTNGSVGQDAGMPPSGGGVSDAGPFGTRNGGIPGAAPLLASKPFFFAGTSPTWVHPIGAMASLQLRFGGGTPDPTLAPLFAEAIDGNGNAFVVSTWVANDLLNLAAPSGGWPQGTTIRLYEQLPSVAGDTLPAPVVIPLQIL